MIEIEFAVGFGQHSLASNITLLRAVEVDEIFEGNDDKYKALTVSSDVIMQRYDIVLLFMFIRSYIHLLVCLLFN